MWQKKFVHNPAHLQTRSSSAQWRLLVIALIVLIVIAAAVRIIWIRYNAQAPPGTSSEHAFFAPFVGGVQDSFALAPYILGFDKSHTFLLLFLNNTEMRPGGGFIGSYGIITTNKGKIISFITNGSENLDWSAPSDFKVEPPAPIKKYLAQSLWYFRDSNWSPDFKASAERVLQFYTAEGGEFADKIDGVIGITPTVLKELLLVTGPIEVNGKIYSSDKVVEELEYHVEYGYKETGAQVAERKTIIGKMGRALIQRLAGTPPWRWKSLIDIVERMGRQKHILFFSRDLAMQETIEKLGLGGRQADTAMSTDFVQLVDANLASLKTDAVIRRSLALNIRRDAGSGAWVAEVFAAYAHEGSYDWKTSRYRSFTRLYVLEGAKFLESRGFIDDVKNKVQVVAEVARENSKQSFGGFWFVDPKKTQTISWKYVLPPSVQAQLNAGRYTLRAQKQLGLERPVRLTVDVDFGTTIRHFEGNLYSDALIELKKE